jgi:uncharacterized membrane protein
MVPDNLNKPVFISDISNQEFPLNEKITATSIHGNLLNWIQGQHPQFSRTQCMSVHELNGFRQGYIAQKLQEESGELNLLQQDVLKSLQEHTLLSTKSTDEESSPMTRGQRIADQVATFGGSWTFILSFGFFLLCWITTNVVFLNNSGFDPYPFILLNLILSCIAALQAPVIMMSQNRQEEKDRQRAKKDYMINLKSELEIRLLHEKLDHLILHQQQELLEIQKIQMDMLTDIANEIKSH